MNRRLIAVMVALLLTGLGAGRAEGGVRRLLIVASGHFDTQAWKQLVPTHPKGPTHLCASDADARMIVELCAVRYGVRYAANLHNIHVLGLAAGAIPNLPKGAYVGADASRKAIIREMEWLAQDTRPGDEALLYYTGHGGTVADLSRDKSLSTEYLVCHDGPLFDFEIDSLLAATHGHLTLVFDCCHSAGMARQIPFGVGKYYEGQSLRFEQFLARCKREAPFHPHGSERLPEGGNRVLLAACGVDQVTAEHRVPGFARDPSRMVSPFTLFLYRTLMSHGPMSYAGLLREIRQQAALWHLDGQPYLEGCRRTLPALFFDPVSDPSLPVKYGRMQAGWLAEVEEGDLFVAPDRTLFLVKEVDLWEARIEPLEPTSRIPTRLKPFRRQLARHVMNFRDILVKNDKNIGIGAAHPDTEMEDRLVVNLARRAEGRYEVSVQSEAGVLSPIYRFRTQREAERKAEGMRRAYQAREQLQAAFAALESASSRPFGLTLISDGGNFRQRYKVGSEINIVVDCERPGYLMLIGLEPDGTISVLLPGTGQEPLKLDRPLGLPQLIARKPVGVTQLTAVLSVNPLAPPQELLVAPQSGGRRYIVPVRFVTRFINWLQGALTVSEADDAGNVRNIGPKDPPTLSPDAVETATLDIVVTE